MENKKINYIVFDVNGKNRRSYIGNLVATSANQKVFVFNDADITTESTAYRSYARIKRADSFNVGPITLLASEITVENTGYTQDELNKFLESINVDYTSCRILILEKQALAVSGPISITVVYDRINELGRTIETQAKAEVTAHLYEAVEEIFTEEEYDLIKEEMLSRDLGDITDSDTEITNAVKFLGKQSGFTKLLPVNLIRDYIGKYNVINLGAVDGIEDEFADDIINRGVYRYEYDDGPFGYAGLLINAVEDGGGRTQMMLEKDYVKYRSRPEGASGYEEWKTFKFDEVHKLIEEGIINDTLESFIEDKVLDKVDEINPRLLNVENNKADRVELQAVASGSPSGIYESLAALQSAIPNGNNKIYITTDNGHWNYFDNVWKSGGVYQENYGNVVIDIEQNSYTATANQKLLKVLGNTKSVEIIDIEPLSFGSYENKVIYIEGKPKVIEQVSKKAITNDDIDSFSGAFADKNFRGVKLKKPIDSSGYGNHDGGMYHIDGFTEFTDQHNPIAYGFINVWASLSNLLIYIMFPDTMTDQQITDYILGKELLYKIPDNEYFVVASLNSVKNLEIASSNGTKLKINETLHKFNEDLVDEVELVDDVWVLKQYTNMYRCAQLPSFGIGSARTFDSVYYFRWQYFEQNNPQYQLDADGIRLDGYEFGDITVDKKGIYVEAHNLIIKIEKSVIDNIIIQKGYSNDNEGKRLAGLDYFNDNDLKIMFKYATPITRTADVILNDLVINADDEIVITSGTGVLPTLQVETTLGLTTIIKKINNDLMQEIQRVEEKIDNFEIENTVVKHFAISALEEAREKNIELSTNDSLNFVAVTDTHSKEYISHMYNVIKLYNERYGNLDCLLHHGDLADGYDTYETHKLELLECAKSLQKLDLPTLVASGNHDAYHGITDKLWNSIVLKAFTNKVNRYFDSQNKNSKYYYTDFEQQKIRIITLDSGRYGYADRQVEWLATEALDFSSKEDDKSNWAVIIQSHMPTREEVNYYLDSQYPLNNATVVENVLKSFVTGTSYNSSIVNVDFTTQGQMEVIMWLNGHGHLDILHKPADLYWHYVMTVNGHHIERIPIPAHLIPLGDKVKLPTKEVGTINEFAFDIFNVDRENRKVTITRIGAGNDREFTY